MRELLRRLRRVPAQPLVAAVLASLTTAVVMPPTVHYEVVERVVVRDPMSPQVLHEITYVDRTRRVNTCDTATIVEAINEALRSSARTGSAAASNDADAKAKAKGDGSTAIAQSGAARSGDAVVGQQIVNALSVCAPLEVVAHNLVTDSKARSGDASVDNDLGGVPTLPPPSPEDEGSTDDGDEDDGEDGDGEGGDDGGGEDDGEGGEDGGFEYWTPHPSHWPPTRDG